MTLNRGYCHQETYQDQDITIFQNSMLPPSKPWYTVTVDGDEIGDSYGRKTEALEAAKAYCDRVAECLAKRKEKLITLTLNCIQVKQLIGACQIASYEFGLPYNQPFQDRRLQFYRIQQQLEKLLGIESDFPKKLTFGREIGVPEIYKDQEIIIFRSPIHRNSKSATSDYTVKVDYYDFLQHFDTQSEALAAAKTYCDRMAEIFAKNQNKIFILTLSYGESRRLMQACKNAAWRLKTSQLLKYLESILNLTLMSSSKEKCVVL